MSYDVSGQIGGLLKYQLSNFERAPLRTGSTDKPVNCTTVFLFYPVVWNKTPLKMGLITIKLLACHQNGVLKVVIVSPLWVCYSKWLGKRKHWFNLQVCSSALSKMVACQSWRIGQLCKATTLARDAVNTYCNCNDNNDFFMCK